MTPLKQPSLYAQYIKERLNKDIIETEQGFATYFFIEGGCYIEDIYVHPDHRHSHVASQLADQIAMISKERGVNKLLGSVVPTSNYSTQSIQVLLAYGFKLDSSTNNLILFSKDI